LNFLIVTFKNWLLLQGTTQTGREYELRHVCLKATPFLSSLIHTHSLSFSNTPSLSHTHTIRLSISHTLSHFFPTRSLSLSFYTSLSVFIYTHTHTHTHSLSLSLRFPFYNLCAFIFPPNFLSVRFICIFQQNSTSPIFTALFRPSVARKPIVNSQLKECLIASTLTLIMYFYFPSIFFSFQMFYKRFTSRCLFFLPFVSLQPNCSSRERSYELQNISDFMFT